MRVLDEAALEAAIRGGLLLSAGGSGMASSARHRKLGEEALRAGEVVLQSLSQLAEGDAIIVSTAVGAPGATGARTEPKDAVDAARLLIASSGCKAEGVIPGHV